MQKRTRDVLSKRLHGALFAARTHPAAVPFKGYERREVFSNLAIRGELVSIVLEVEDS